MKFSIAICVLFGIAVAVAVEPEMRLIEFNETYRTWISIDKVENMAKECGTEKEHGGFMDVTDFVDFSASGLAQKVKDRLAASKFPTSVKHQAQVNGYNGHLTTDKLTEYDTKLSSYATRYYTSDTGKQAAHWIKEEFERNKAGRHDISVELFPHSWAQPSVIARIEGTGDYADEVVIISAHEDSIVSSGSNAPGADDDASGTSCVLEVFRVLAAAGFKPDRTIEFHTYSAEEVGLRGSQAVASVYQANGVPVYAQMQLDMTFYVKPGSAETFGIITDYVDPDLTAFLKVLVKAYSSLGFTTSTCGYGCSDHASWTKAGYASCFPFESSFSNLNPYIHSKNDLIQNLSVEHGLEFAKVATGFLVELSLIN